MSYQYIQVCTSTYKYVLVYTSMNLFHHGLYKYMNISFGMFRGVMRARCYPFDMPKRRFHGFNPKVPVHTLVVVVHTSTYWYIRWLLLFILVYTIMYTDVLNSCVQDTVVIVPPFPYSIEENHHDVPLEDCWYASPQLFFKCQLRPKHGRLPKNRTYKAGPGIYKYVLVCHSMYSF